MGDHESCEEDVNRLHDRGGNHLRPGVVPVKVQRRENRQEDRVEECAVVRDWSRSESLEDSRAELKSDLLHSDVWLHQVTDDLLNVDKLLGGGVGILADKRRQESAKGWDQVLHAFAPIGFDRCRVEDTITEGRVVRLHLLGAGDERCVDLESIADIVA